MSSKNWQLTTPLPLLQKMLVVSLICLFNKSESNRMLVSRMHNRSVRILDAVGAKYNKVHETDD